jgi:hypothetical protein
MHQALEHRSAARAQGDHPNEKGDCEQPLVLSDQGRFVVFPPGDGAGEGIGARVPSVSRTSRRCSRHAEFHDGVYGLGKSVAPDWLWQHWCAGYL